MSLVTEFEGERAEDSPVRDDEVFVVLRVQLRDGVEKVVDGEFGTTNDAHAPKTRRRVLRRHNGGRTRR